MWVDEPKGALANGITDLGNQSFKALYSHPRDSYAHQFANITCRGSACLQQVFVEWLWQQMNERKFGGQTNAYLLMASKWVLPGRKTKESDAILFEEVFDVKNILVLQNTFEKTRKQMKVNTLSINALSDNLNFPMFAKLILKKT